MADKLIIDNRTGKGTEYLLAHLGAVLMLGAEGLGDEKAVLFDDGVTIHMIKNERSVRYLVLQREPFGEMAKTDKQTDHPGKVLRNFAAPGDLAVGDYVFASGWSDCDWNDPWAIGFVASLLPYGVTLGNEDGGSLDRVGIKYWKFAMRISAEQGQQIIEHYPEMESSRFDPDVAAQWFADQE